MSGLRPMSIERFLTLSEGIPDYKGADADDIRRRMRRAVRSIERGERLLSQEQVETLLTRI
jgi:hypothetical protein